VTLGGGTRKATVTIGGAKTVAYGGARDACGAKPVLAVDVLDTKPEEWPPVWLWASPVASSICRANHSSRLFTPRAAIRWGNSERSDFHPRPRRSCRLVS
jgi:hypothetical protein